MQSESLLVRDIKIDSPAFIKAWSRGNSRMAKRVRRRGGSLRERFFGMLLLGCREKARFGSDFWECFCWVDFGGLGICFLVDSGGHSSGLNAFEKRTLGIFKAWDLDLDRGADRQFGFASHSQMRRRNPQCPLPFPHFLLHGWIRMIPVILRGGDAPWNRSDDDGLGAGPPPVVLLGLACCCAGAG